MLLLLKLHLVNHLYKVQIRHYSSKTNQKVSQVEYKTLFDSLDKYFIEWFVGFVDAEGCFQVRVRDRREKNKGLTVELSFLIHLHKDDLPLLTLIQKTLGCGNIRRSGKQFVLFEVTRRGEIFGLIIPIFESFPLNSVKYLDYLAFKKAAEFILQNKHHSPEELKTITSLQNIMNSQRIEYDLPSNHSIRITLPWLIGFTEGDGSFTTNKNYPVLCWTLSSRELNLLKAIREFLGGQGHLSTIQTKILSQKDKSYLIISKIDLLFNTILPLFNSHGLYSVKAIDYFWWSNIVELNYFGYHKLNEGLALIEKIKGQINLSRRNSKSLLDTNPSSSPLYKEVRQLLTSPAPYIIKEGNRLNVKTGRLVSSASLSEKE